MTNKGRFCQAKQKVEEKRAERRERRHQKWAKRFPFNLLGEMWGAVQK